MHGFNFQLVFSIELFGFNFVFKNIVLFNRIYYFGLLIFKSIHTYCVLSLLLQLNIDYEF